MAKVFRFLVSLASLALVFFLIFVSLKILMYLFLLILFFALLWQIPFFRNWLLVRFHKIIAKQFEGTQFQNNYENNFQENSTEEETLFEIPLQENSSTKDITEEVRIIEDNDNDNDNKNENENVNEK